MKKRGVTCRSTPCAANSIGKFLCSSFSCLEHYSFNLFMLHGDLDRVFIGYLYGKREQLLTYRKKIIMYIQLSDLSQCPFHRFTLKQRFTIFDIYQQKNYIFNKPSLAYTEIIFDGLAYLVKQPSPASQEICVRVCLWYVLSKNNFIVNSSCLSPCKYSSLASIYLSLWQ